jgi:hypothetical protein
MLVGCELFSCCRSCRRFYGGPPGSCHIRGSAPVWRGDHSRRSCIDPPSPARGRGASGESSKGAKCRQRPPAATSVLWRATREHLSTSIGRVPREIAATASVPQQFSKPRTPVVRSRRPATAHGAAVATSGREIPSPRQDPFEATRRESRTLWPIAPYRSSPSS